MTRVAMVAVGVVSFGAAFALGCGSLETQDAADDGASSPAATAATLDGVTAVGTAGRATAEPTGTPLAPSPVGTWDKASMVVIGEVWQNAEPAKGRVRAFIAGVQCGEAETRTAPDAYVPEVMLTVWSQQERAGCGSPGVTVEFEINGSIANQLVTWNGGAAVGVKLSSGPEGAIYKGRVRKDDAAPGLGIEPIIEGKVCGRQLNSFRGAGPLYAYEVLVYPEEVHPGCGRVGVHVLLRAFNIDLDTGQKIELGTLEGVAGPWRPGNSTSLGDAAIATEFMPE